jgi:enoyl-CoA hydratase/carnithine racemase
VASEEGKGRIAVEDRGTVRLLALENPQRRNAVDAVMLGRLREELERATTDGVRCLVLRGAGEAAFCSGYDLASLAAIEIREDGPLPDAPLLSTLAALSAVGPPVVASVVGAAFGAGCELACACDLRVAEEGAFFCMPPAKLGIIYSAEGLARVSALAGLSRAKEMFFTGERVDARTALSWGLVDRVTPKGDGLGAALSLADAIARNAPLAVQGMRRLFARLGGLDFDREESEAIERSRRASFASEDAREGRAAFLEKRAPVFRGR